MIKSIAILSILTTATVVQSNPLIPSGISPSCAAFFTKLDSDSSLRACTKPLIDASAHYGPSSNLSDPASTSQMSSSLSTLCAPATSSSCPDTFIRSKIADFYGACAPELTSTPNKDVIRAYDVLYTLKPMWQAICSQDDQGRYCVTETADNFSPSSSNLTAAGGDSSAGKIKPSDLWISSLPSARKRTTQAVLYPNTTTYSSTNLPFFFLSPDLPKDKLCVTCTRRVLTSYTNFESSVPYAPGLPNSPILKGQPKLYEAVQNTCGKSFMSNNVQAAGSLGSGVLQGGASRVVAGELMDSILFGSMVMGALGFAVIF